MYEIYWFYGDYPYRQRLANEAGVDVYVEQHFNSGPKSADYCMALVAHNATDLAIAMAERYAALVAEEFGVPTYRGHIAGVKIAQYRERGDFNLRFIKDRPAILLEPLFVSNEDHVRILLEESGIARLAEVTCKWLKEFFPEGGKIGFSVGHKYKRRNPTDRGAPVRGYPEFFEADLAEWVLWQCYHLFSED